MKFSEQLHQQAAAIEQAAKAIEKIESAMSVMAVALAAFMPEKPRGVNAFVRPETMREPKDEGGIGGSGVDSWDLPDVAA